MLIDCPGCGKSYHIVRALLGPHGRRVACPRCDAIWFVAAQNAGTEDAGTEDAGTENAGTGATAAEAEPRSAIDPDRPGESWPATMELSAAGRKPQVPAPRAARSGATSGALCGGSSALVIGSALLAFSMALIGLRAQVVRVWPRAASAYAALGLPVNLRGLEFDHLQTVVIDDGSGRVLGIDGQITNLRGRAAALPAIRLAVLDARGQRLYQWTVQPPKPRLGAHETIGFRARLAAPPQAGHDVLVDFGPALDMTAARSTTPARKTPAAAPGPLQRLL